MATVPAHIKMPQTVIDRSQHGTDNVSSQTGQNHLCLWITKTAVKFDNVRPGFGQHQTNIKNAAIGRAFVMHAAGNRFDHPFHYLIFKLST